MANFNSKIINLAIFSPRWYVSRRLLALSEGEIAALTTSMRQIGVGTPGGAEALAIFHEYFFDEWITGSLSAPLARINVDEKNCFGVIEWQAVRGGGVAVFSQSTQQQQRGNIDRNTAPASRTHSQIAESLQLSAWRPRKAHRCPRPTACVAEKRRLGRSKVHGRR